MVGFNASGFAQALRDKDLLQPISLPQIRQLTLATAPRHPFLPMIPTPRLKDSATTLDKAVNYKEVLKFLGIDLSDSQRRFLEENKFLLIPKKETRLEEETDLPMCMEPVDEMLTVFDRVGGETSAQKRKPENARLITPDVVLHAFHKYIDNSLRELEKDTLGRRLQSFLKDMRTSALKHRDATKDSLPSEHYETIGAQMTAAAILVDNADWDESPATSENTDGEVDTLANGLRLLKKYEGKFRPETLRKIEHELSFIYRASEVAVSPLYGHYLPKKVELDGLHSVFSTRALRIFFTAESIFSGYDVPRQKRLLSQW